MKKTKSFPEQKQNLPGNEYEMNPAYVFLACDTADI
jgi:hypothetical protein